MQGSKSRTEPYMIGHGFRFKNFLIKAYGTVKSAYYYKIEVVGTSHVISWKKKKDSIFIDPKMSSICFYSEFETSDTLIVEYPFAILSIV